MNQAKVAATLMPLTVVAFFADVKSIWNAAHADGRSWLEYDEWARFFDAAIKHGLFSAEKAKQARGMDMAHEQHRFVAISPNFWSRLIGETYRKVKDAKENGLRARDCRMEMNGIVDAMDADAERKEREMAAMRKLSLERAKDLEEQRRREGAQRRKSAREEWA